MTKLQARANELRTYLARDRNLEQICARFKITSSTVYRWMEALEDAGVEVLTVGFKRPRTYRISK